MADLKYSDRKTTVWLADYDTHITNMLDSVSIPQCSSMEHISVTRYRDLDEAQRKLTGIVGEKLWDAMTVEQRWFYIIGKYDGENSNE